MQRESNAMMKVTGTLRGQLMPPTQGNSMTTEVFASNFLKIENRQTMSRDYTIVLWLLKLGGLLNLYFLLSVSLMKSGGADVYVVLSAQILFTVSAYRCFFPVRYEHNVVFHDSRFSSIFATRLFATFSEVAYIFLFSYVLRALNVGRVEWVTVLSWLMVAQVVISQWFVWTAILTEQFEYYVYEEFGWAFIFAANTLSSGYLYVTVGAAGGRKVLLLLNLLFGILYLPWQAVHLASLRADAKRNAGNSEAGSLPIAKRLADGLQRAMRIKNRRTDADAWGGGIGLTWMMAYWATLIPMWTHYIVRALCSR
jgi:hypothetical protein